MTTYPVVAQSVRDVAVLVGSLRRESITRKVAQAIMGLAPASLTLEIVEIRDLPLYNEDFEANIPAAWSQFRARISRADAVLFMTPEYNRSIPSPLKNAIDVGSRPYGKSSWAGKPAAVVSVSPGAMGGFGANHHIRQSLVFLDMPTLQQPEVYLAHADKLLDATGRITSDSTRAFLTSFLQTFDAWIERTKPVMTTVAAG
jgi:chromate reductase, NAD(P)H dehydrogenase (quinone)